MAFIMHIAYISSFKECMLSIKSHPLSVTMSINLSLTDNFFKGAQQEIQSYVFFESIMHYRRYFECAPVEEFFHF